MHDDKHYGDDKTCEILIFSLAALPHGGTEPNARFCASKRLHPVGGTHGYILYVIPWSYGGDTQPILIVPPPDWMELNPLAERQEVADPNGACRGLRVQ
jgi:hypothetical protein